MSLREDIGGRTVSLVFPPSIAAAMLPLLQVERAEFEAVFGAPVVFVEEDPGEGPRWLIRFDAARAHNRLEWFPDQEILLSSCVDEAGFSATLQLLHSLVTLNTNRLDDVVFGDVSANSDRVLTEIARGFPGFGIRGLDWRDLVDAMLPQDPIGVGIEHLERLIARLQDGHTAVRRLAPVYNPPYAVELSPAGATLFRVPAWSQAALAGVMAGWHLEIPDRQQWLSRSGAPPHAHAFIAGRRAIALTDVSERAFVARSPEGNAVRWTERNCRLEPEHLVSKNVVAGNIVIVRLQNWLEGYNIAAFFDEVIAAHPDARVLVLDLRGNTGGSLLLAQAVRRKFLRQRTLLGTIQFTRGDGALADPVELWEEPDPIGVWAGHLVALTDPLTYSASEDFLHGLQGLPHVTVIGTRSGGGSGRPRTIPLIPGWVITVSTALTFDREGRCIEHFGIPVDIECDPFSEEWRSHLETIAG